MTICGIDIKGSEAIFAVATQGAHGLEHVAIATKKIALDDDESAAHVKAFAATLAAFVWQQETGTVFDPALGRPGTPWLGTHSVFESCSRLSDKAEVPISLEISDAPVLRSRTAYYLLFNGISGD